MNANNNATVNGFSAAYEIRLRLGVFDLVVEGEIDSEVHIEIVDSIMYINRN